MVKEKFVFLLVRKEYCEVIVEGEDIDMGDGMRGVKYTEPYTSMFVEIAKEGWYPALNGIRRYVEGEKLIEPGGE